MQYGTSLRVAGERDVFVEGIKDAAIGMYDRDVAMRTRDRLAELQNFDTMTPDRARTLGQRVSTGLSRRRSATRSARRLLERMHCGFTACDERLRPQARPQTTAI